MELSELKIRRDFMNWFCFHFHHINDMSYNLSLEDIIDLFDYVYQERRKCENTLGQNQIKEILDITGFQQDPKQTKYSLGLKYEAFVERSDEYVSKFLEFNFSNKDKMHMRRIRNLNQTTKIVKDIDSTLGTDEATHLLQFYHTWCVDTRKNFKEIPTTWSKAIVGRVNEAYRLFCEINECAPLSTCQLRKFLIAQGHTHCSGSYACGLSGQSYFYNLYIPGTGYFFKKFNGFTADAELEFASLHNQIVLRINDKFYTGDGKETLMQHTMLKNSLNEKLKQIVPVMFKDPSAIINENGNASVTEVTNDADTDESMPKQIEDVFEFTEYTECTEFTEDQLEGPTGLGEFTDTENSLLEEDKTVVEVEDETLQMLSKLGFTADKVEEISGKKMKSVK